MCRQHLSCRFHDRAGRKCASFVGRPAISRHPMIIQWFRRRIRDFDEDRRNSCTKNQILEKPQGPNNSDREKGPKNGFSGDFWVAGIPWSPATMGWATMGLATMGLATLGLATMAQGRRATMGLGPICRPSSGRRIFAVFRPFSLLFSSVFFLESPLFSRLDFPGKNLMRSCANQIPKFPLFWKNRTLCREELPIFCQASKLGQTMSE